MTFSVLAIQDLPRTPVAVGHVGTGITNAGGVNAALPQCKCSGLLSSGLGVAALCLLVGPALLYPQASLGSVLFPKQPKYTDIAQCTHPFLPTQINRPAGREEIQRDSESGSSSDSDGD